VKLLNFVFTVSADVAVVAESLDATDSMLRQILDGLLQPISFDVRDRELLIWCVLILLGQATTFSIPFNGHVFL